MDHASSQYQHDAPLSSRPLPAGAAAAAAGRYLSLFKPGIVFGNLVSAMGGFFLAARGHVDLALFIATQSGIALIVAAACAFNNCIDRDIDRAMARTRHRLLAKGGVAPSAVLACASALGLLGAGVLAVAVNGLALALALLGFVVYVGIYSLWLKRRSVWSTAVGSLSGALPPAIGYCAVSGRFDTTAVLLLLMFALWQIPHFHAIALFRRADYRAAGIPLLPVDAARKHIIGAIAGFTVAALALTVHGATGPAYFCVALFVGIWWLALAVKGRRAADPAAWARRLFFFSLVAVAALSFMMAVDFARS